MLLKFALTSWGRYRFPYKRCDDEQKERVYLDKMNVFLKFKYSVGLETYQR